MGLTRFYLLTISVANIVLATPDTEPWSHPRLCVAPIPEKYQIADKEEPGCNPGKTTTLTSPFGDVLTTQQDLWSTSQYSLEFWFAQQVRRSPLMVDDCHLADVVYVPLMTLWAGKQCPGGQKKMVAQFISDISTLLPLLPDKPHFMTTPRVLDMAFSGIDAGALTKKGISLFTIEGDPSNPAIIEVPYPSAYHHHAGLTTSRFIEHALKNKSQLVFQSIGINSHSKNDLKLRKALHQACLDSTEGCVDATPKSDGDESRDFIEAFWQNASSAWYCMQPTGHSVTRKSTFDCLLAGSIPVFFDVASAAHFPWSDLISPLDLVMILDKSDVGNSHQTLAQIDLQDRQARIQKIARLAHLFQYSLTPRSGLISWQNIDKIDRWDDAFTFALKTLLRRLRAQDLLV